MAERTQLVRSQEALVEHARRTIWCSPYQDDQYIFELSEITSSSGSVTYSNVFGRYINLPTKEGVYHLYMIGGNFSFNLGLPDVDEEWIKITDWCNQEHFNPVIYGELGRRYPLHAVHFLKEYDDTLILAVKEVPYAPVKLGKEKLYIHLRTAYGAENDDDNVQGNRLLIGATSLGRDGLADLPEEFSFIENHKAEVDLVQYFKDGVPSNDLIGSEYHTNVEEIMDPSIVRHEYHRVGDLTTYRSEIDLCYKYLLYLYPHDGELNEDKLTVHYRDDIEIMLVKMEDGLDRVTLETNDGTIQMDSKIITDGCYYTRNEENSLRMVTHQSYGLPIDKVHRMIERMDEKKELDKWYLKVIVHKSGLERKLTPERNGIYTLDSLTYADKINAMTGTESNIQRWKAFNLEKSSYNFLMRCYYEEVTPDVVYDAYGYTQTAKAIADPNVSMSKQNNIKQFILPVSCQERSTIYEYDIDGRLLGYYHHQRGYRYLPYNEDTVFVEAIIGYGSNDPSIEINPENIIFDSKVSKRIYRGATSSEGNVLTPFSDITSDIQLDETHPVYKPVLDAKSGETILVYSDDSFLANSFTVDRSYTGILSFTITYGPLKRVPYVPYDKIAVWLNGRALVEGVDYHVKFPKVYVVTKSGMDKSPETVNITYRCMGPVDEDLNRTKIREIGFIYDETLSLDDDSTPHQFTIMKLMVDNGIYNPRVVKFDEHNEAKVKKRNGTIYSIEDHYIPLSGFGGNTNAYSDYLDELAFRRKVTDYLDKRNESKPSRVPDKVTILEPYQLYSPFLAAVVSKLMKAPRRYYNFDYNDTKKLKRFAKPLEYLLDVDPAYIGYDKDFIEVHPIAYYPEEPIVIHYRLYAIIEAVAELYLKYPVDINHWFKVTRTR